jgi:hypothetical protein
MSNCKAIVTPMGEYTAIMAHDDGRHDGHERYFAVVCSKCEDHCSPAGHSWGAHYGEEDTYAPVGQRVGCEKCQANLSVHGRMDAIMETAEEYLNDVETLGDDPNVRRAYVDWFRNARDVTPMYDRRYAAYGVKV